MKSIIIFSIFISIVTFSKCITIKVQMETEGKTVDLTPLNKMMPEVPPDDDTKDVDQDDEKDNFDLFNTMIDCNETFRVERAYIIAFNESGSFPDETDRTPMCFMRCVLEKANIFSEAGEFDVSRTAEVYSGAFGGNQDEIKEIATTCSKRDETCRCDKSYQFIKCLMETIIQNNEKKET